MSAPTILVIDDEPQIRRVVRHALKADGARVLESLLVALRYPLVLVPAVIVAADMRPAARGCPSCAATRHDVDAALCGRCGDRLPRPAGAAAR